jgi:hypothetical protein
LLLNVVRACKRQPLHFSALTRVTGRASTSLSPGLSLPFGGDAGATYLLDLGASGGGGATNIEVLALDQQEFIRGIMNPISPATLQYFLAQGWPQELLLTLLLSQVDKHKNTPGPAGTFSRLEDFVEHVRNLELEFKQSELGPVFEAKITDLPDLISKAQAADLVLRSMGEAANNTKSQEGFETLGGPNASDSPEVTGRFQLFEGAKKLCLRTKTEKDKKDETNQDSSPDSHEISTLVRNENRCSEADSGNPEAALRSIEGIIYYLGQLMRHQGGCPDEESGDPWRLTPDSAEVMPTIQVPAPGNLDGLEDSTEEAILFYAREATAGDRDPLVSVKHEGRRYVIPRHVVILRQVGDKETQEVRQHRSMSVFSLISQLLGLGRSRQELPTTGIVTVVSGG